MQMIISNRCSLNVEHLLSMSKDEFFIMYKKHDIDHDKVWSQVSAEKEKREQDAKKEKVIIIEPSKAGSHESDNKPARKNGRADRRIANGGSDKG